MQTFLPFSCFTESAKALDNKRLGKQRVETLQLLKALFLGPEFNGRKTPWFNHPACKMWRGNDRSLIRYGIIICSEWISRGYKDTCLGKIEQFRPYFANESDPSWLSNVEFHLSHQSNLIRKDAVFYGDKFPGVPSNLEYVWPCG